MLSPRRSWKPSTRRSRAGKGSDPWPAGGQNPAPFVRQIYLTLINGKVYFTHGEGMEALRRKLEIYIDAKGKRPFVEWRDSLDINTRARVRTRLNKVEGGNLGDHHAEGGGVF